jgi:D-alanyl-lipoteichoic acid acyltransferase DltB (MBOAT superfamily)
MSYIIEVYRGKMKPEKNFGIYALFVMFYPQLVAGPIERPQNMLHQFHEKHYFDSARIIDGLRLMLWGFFKKIVIADNLAIIVNAVYKNPSVNSGLTLLVATYFFAFQIYCDFAGYTDIARGAARVMGFELVPNFDKPYLAENVAEFWRRWHISLSTWFRDYVYYPLGGNRLGFSRQCLNLIIVFCLSGLWHGASWNFVVWGALHGTFVIAWHLFRKYKRPAVGRAQFFLRLISILVTFHAVTFAWIFFRARTLSDAFYVITHLFRGVSIQEIQAWVPGYAPSEIILSWILVLCLIVAQLLDRRWSLRRVISHQPVLVRAGIYAFLFVVWCFFLITGDVASQRFIYFQF